LIDKAFLAGNGRYCWSRFAYFVPYLLHAFAQWAGKRRIRATKLRAREYNRFPQEQPQAAKASIDADAAPLTTLASPPIALAIPIVDSAIQV